MNVILYMAMTLNGFIARTNGETDFVSEEEWKLYSEMVKKAGNIVIGRKTYDVMLENKEFEKLGNPRVVVITHDYLEDYGKVMFSTGPVSKIISFLERENFKQIIVAGGSQLNASFLKENLVDEIYIDVEPKIIGEGISIFSKEEIDLDLELIDINQFSDTEIQLHYKVKK